ncbi:MAG: hypothetical protein U1D55_14820 [Phycisphaerae bacterium]
MLLSLGELDRPSSVLAVREVRVDVHYERRAVLADFYVDLLGLAAWSASRQIPGGWGAGDGRSGVFFQFRHDPRIDPLRTRLCVLSNSLERVAARLRERGWPFEQRRGFFWSDCHIRLADPSGNIVEIRQTRPV